EIKPLLSRKERSPTIPKLRTDCSKRVTDPRAAILFRPVSEKSMRNKRITRCPSIGFLGPFPPTAAVVSSPLPAKHSHRPPLVQFRFRARRDCRRPFWQSAELKLFGQWECLPSPAPW